MDDETKSPLPERGDATAGAAPRTHLFSRIVEFFSHPAAIALVSGLVSAVIVQGLQAWRESMAWRREQRVKVFQAAVEKSLEAQTLVQQMLAVDGDMKQAIESDLREMERMVFATAQLEAGRRCPYKEWVKPSYRVSAVLERTYGDCAKLRLMLYEVALTDVSEAPFVAFEKWEQAFDEASFAYVRRDQATHPGVRPKFEMLGRLDDVAAIEKDMNEKKEKEATAAHALRKEVRELVARMMARFRRYQFD